MPRRSSVTPAEGGESTDTAGIGERLRTVRLQKGLTLEQVSAKTGIALSTLSKIENDKTAVGFQILMRLCDCLDVPLGSLGRGTRLFAPNVRSITRRGQGETIDSPNYVYELLSADLVRKGIFPSIIQCKHRSLEEHGAWSQHEGEEFLYILRGAIELHTKLYSPVRLETGDTMHYDSSMHHAMISVGAEDAVVLSVCHTTAGETLLPAERRRIQRTSAAPVMEGRVPRRRRATSKRTDA